MLLPLLMKPCRTVFTLALLCQGRDSQTLAPISIRRGCSQADGAGHAMRAVNQDDRGVHVPNWSALHKAPLYLAVPNHNAFLAA